ncbi:iron-sulfur cluster assembly scaffold protein [Erythrobacter sp. HKB08]|uniref:iron-sulfur cluster assembly scaffold protein n=1 Tax=Erythrobacter sp. HKB08 TaxID=2502843 RepID=UPI001008AD81|nr:iron-sulfur cluster assembly scaffold protein [Erythrobacter sp. HKB08]
MAASAADKLYTPTILALAVELANYPNASDLELKGEARSKSCGSTVDVGIGPGPDRKISEIGISVKACAIGQAAAAIFAAAAKGKSLDELKDEQRQLEGWLRSGGATPRIKRIELLEHAREYPARHDAILLPWKAAIAALSNGPSPR